MTRAEARLIAEELHKLMRQDIVEQISRIVSESVDRTLSTEEVAKRLGCTKKTVYNNIADIPHRKAGKRLIFSERAIAEYVRLKSKN